MASPSSPRSGRSGGKRRWTAEERRAKGRGPRRGGAWERDRGARPQSGDDASRGDRPRYAGPARRDDDRDDSARPTDGRGYGDRRFEDRQRSGYGSTGRDDRRYGGARRGDSRYDDRSRGGYRGDSERRDRGPAQRDSYRQDDRGRDGSGYQRRDDRSRDERGGRFGANRFERGGSRYDDRRGAQERRGDDRTWGDRGRDDRYSDNRASGNRFSDDRRRDDRFSDDRRRDDRFSDDRRFDDRDRAPRRDFSDRGRRPAGDRGPRYRSERPWASTERPRTYRTHSPERVERDSGPASDTMEWTPTVQEPVLEESAATEPVVSGFSDLGVPQQLVSALAAQGIDHPFSIQRDAIPDALGGRDVLGRGRTGSGKTLAFGLPLLARLAQSDHGRPAALVLEPTRELAMQVADVLSPLAATLGQSVVLVAGGMSYGPQLKAFERGVDIVVATPGRLIDLMDQAAADLSGVQITVLDEADHMADLGFLPDVTKILDAVAPDGQRMLFSATLDSAVDSLVRRYLHDPTIHEVDPERSTVTTMEHQVLLVQPSEKDAVIAEIVNREGRTVVFVRTQHGADRVAEQLRASGVMAGALHGGLTQGARARVLAAFKSGTMPVLVATDVAARGLHIDDVSLVLQADPPLNSKDYLHRAGRTARAGERGVVATMVLPHQQRQVTRLVGRAGARVKPVAVRPGEGELSRLTGARPLGGEPIPEERYREMIAPQPSRPKSQGGYRGKRRPARRETWGRRPGGRGERSGGGDRWSR